MEENKNNKTIEIFQNASVPKAVINNVVPSIISMIMVLVYNLADTFFIGKTNNAFMVAAVSVATPAFLIFMAIGMLFGIGGTSLISRMLVEKREEWIPNRYQYKMEKNARNVQSTHHPFVFGRAFVLVSYQCF